MLSKGNPHEEHCALQQHETKRQRERRAEMLTQTEAYFGLGSLSSVCVQASGEW